MAFSASFKQSAVTTHSEDDFTGETNNINQYRIVRFLGKGSHGTVYLAQDEVSRTEYAIKQIITKSTTRPKKRPAKRRGSLGQLSAPDNRPLLADKPCSIAREIAILKKLNHPNCVRLFEVLELNNNEQWFIVMELCSGGPLMVLGNSGIAQGGPIHPVLARSYIQQLVLGLEYLHAHMIIHRDLKLDNLLLTDNKRHLKIIDFGVSEMFTEPTNDWISSAELIGSPSFMAPELCNRATLTSTISGRASDIWSVGVILYCMIYGRLPFLGTNIVELLSMIRTHDPDFDSAGPDSCIHLIKTLLDKNPVSRITLDQIRTDPWLTNSNTQPLPENNVTEIVHPEHITPDELKSAISKVSQQSTWAVVQFIAQLRLRVSQTNQAGSLLVTKRGRRASLPAVLNPKSPTTPTHGALPGSLDLPNRPARTSLPAIFDLINSPSSTTSFVPKTSAKRNVASLPAILDLIQSPGSTHSSKPTRPSLDQSSINSSSVGHASLDPLAPSTHDSNLDSRTSVKRSSTNTSLKPIAPSTHDSNLDSPIKSPSTHASLDPLAPSSHDSNLDSHTSVKRSSTNTSLEPLAPSTRDSNLDSPIKSPSTHASLVPLAPSTHHSNRDSHTSIKRSSTHTSLEPLAPSTHDSYLDSPIKSPSTHASLVPLPPSIHLSVNSPSTHASLDIRSDSDVPATDPATGQPAPRFIRIRSLFPAVFRFLKGARHDDSSTA